MITLNPQDSVEVSVLFDLQELEFHICDLADQRNREDDTRSVPEERHTTHGPQPQTPDAPPSPGHPMIPDDFPLYEEWEKPHTPRSSIHHCLQATNI